VQSQLADLQSQLALLMADKAQAAAQQARTAAALDESQRERTRLDGLLADLMTHQTRMTAALETQRARAQQAEQALTDTTTSRDELSKTIADLQVELQTVSTRLRALEPLAAGGRLARELGSELSAALAAIDGRTRHLLTHSALDADYRREAETLRAEALAALSLARQVASRRAFEVTEG
jgi:chromosome segregation ATPase